MEKQIINLDSNYSRDYVQLLGQKKYHNIGFKKKMAKSSKIVIISLTTTARDGR
jgi:hypothetical protein